MIPARLRGAAGLLVDIALPLAVYYAARTAGVPERFALIAAAIVAAVRIGWVMLRTRQVTWIATLMLAGYMLGLVLTFLSGDARFVLLKDSFTTAAISVITLLSAVYGRPVTLTLAKSLVPAKADAMQHGYETDASVRRHFQNGTRGWGIGMIIEALVRIPVIYLLPLDVATVASQVLMLVFVTVLVIWTRHRRASRDAGSAVTTVTT